MEETAKMPVYWHRAMLDHVPPDGLFKFPAVEFMPNDEAHPECPARIENVKGVIDHLLSDVTDVRSARPASRSELTAVHDETHVEWVEEFAMDGGGRFDGTTTGGNEHTFEAARYASGASIQAVEEAVATPADVIPYALVRPPGHHAQSDRPDGFCFFNNVAVAAQHVLDSTDVESVAIVDWDVHHGNGTQEIFYDRDDVLLLSIHHDHGSWHPEYHPQEGAMSECGVGDGEGYTVNVPTTAATGNVGYAHVLETIVEPILAEYRPDLILVGAGQDGGIADPNARNMVDRVGYRSMANTVRSYAERYAGGNLAVVQEGGYQASHIAIATLGVLEGFLGIQVDLSPYGIDEDPFAWLDECRDPLESRVQEAVDFYSKYWSL